MHRSFRCAFIAGLFAFFCISAMKAAHAGKPFLPSASDSSISSPAHHWVTGRLAERVRLGDGLHTYLPSLHQLGVTYLPGQSDKTPITEVRFSVNRVILRKYLTKIAPLVLRHPLDARPVMVADADYNHQEVPARIEPGHNGAVLRINAAVDRIQDELAKYPMTRHIVLPVRITPQKITARDLAGINGRIGFFETYYDPYDVGRTQTVRLATEKVNRTVLQPGQIFSLNKTVGPRNPAHGFTGKGNVFIDGHMALQYGDGMCQIATTLFNAALISDLKIVERHQHMRTVPYAVPGSDATVYYGQKDLRIANDTDAPIYIAARTTAFHDIVDIYGKMVPGRHVKIVRKYQQIAKRHVIGSIDRIVYEPNGTKQKGPYYRSDYKWTAALSFKHQAL